MTETDTGFLLKLTCEVKNELEAMGKKKGGKVGADWIRMSHSQANYVPFSVITNICAEMFGAKNLEEGRNWMAYVLDHSVLVQPAKEEKPLTVQEKAEIKAANREYARMVGNIGMSPYEDDEPNKSFIRELSDTIFFLWKIVGPILSVIAVFLAVFWVLYNTHRYSKKEQVTYSTIAAFIAAFAEIGLAVIRCGRKKRIEERKERKKKAKQIIMSKDVVSTKLSEKDMKTGKLKDE
ncbi:uncharacterized protein MONOS_5705 [Monocercomonoides exilis]|uniref:uncharacterized protein n=1 Tax=Monocercomonoides exilis TaxID=2049356 RepID=UPI003559A97D|nr:hypothetical protein MONOS_5705 [Monocercomonoides exilis]|eukprot:MONOS_5705.1-p1 / transcript=MONOS_5705.1 / gene=MONOS_5705 / organism=Monocercomonoides_exilis_PA203 / gene_product=unspecified product / transcript_product=unspecified product / location=Mono_scaffold00169:92089-92891(-) / protein_length=235 / sequence_SO=supercontig / SO=protein_coding / is_pseudo=false